MKRLVATLGVAVTLAAAGTGLVACGSDSHTVAAKKKVDTVCTQKIDAKGFQYCEVTLPPLTGDNQTSQVVVYPYWYTYPNGLPIPTSDYTITSRSSSSSPSSLPPAGASWSRVPAGMGTPSSLLTPAPSGTVVKIGPNNEPEEGQDAVETEAEAAANQSIIENGEENAGEEVGAIEANDSASATGGQPGEAPEGGAPGANDPAPANDAPAPANDAPPPADTGGGGFDGGAPAVSDG